MAQSKKKVFPDKIFGTYQTQFELMFIFARAEEKMDNGYLSCPPKNKKDWGDIQLEKNVSGKDFGDLSNTVLLGVTFRHTSL